MPNCLTISSTQQQQPNQYRRCSSNLHNSHCCCCCFLRQEKNCCSKSPLYLEFKFLKHTKNLHKFDKGTANETVVNRNQQATTISSCNNNNMGTSRKASSPSNASTYYKPAPAEICHRNMRFLITDRPSDVTIYQFIDELKKHNCQEVVRVCEPTYRTEPLNKEHITVLDWEFPDGNPPPKEIRDKWIQLVKKRFIEDPGSCIAVHCVAGLGRAPVLVALALMEAGMKYEDAVDLIRQHRRGAINQRQLTYLEKYKSAGQLKKRDNCCMM